MKIKKFRFGLNIKKNIEWEDEMGRKKAEQLAKHK